MQGIRKLTEPDRLDNDDRRANRAGAKRSFLREKKPRSIWRRVGLLAVAIAVPAMASPGIEAPEDGAAIRFLLADVPDIGDAPPPGLVPAHQEMAVAATIAETFPAAPSMQFSGSLTDRARAQQCLVMAVYYEAASESVDGQRAVAQVVMNRVRHPSYPNTVCGVVFQGSERSTGCQFSFTCDGSLARRPNTTGWLRAESVARAALGGFVHAGVGLATHYHATYVAPPWAPSLDPVGRIGLHQFYRWRGEAGRPAAFRASYTGGEPLPRRNLASASYSPAPSAGITEPSAPRSAQMVSTRTIEEPRAIEPAAPVLAGHEQSGSIRAEYANSGQWLAQP